MDLPAGVTLRPWAEGDDLSLLDRAVEEFLRVFYPTQALARTVTRDVEFHGCSMKKGDRSAQPDRPIHLLLSFWLKGWA